MKKITPISHTKDLMDYHESVGDMVRSSTKAAYQDVSRKVKAHLESLGIKHSRVLITGSDARLENPIFLRKNSPGELIVTAKTDDIVPVRDLKQIEQELKEKWFKIEELKGSEDVRMFFKWNDHVVFPTRVYDAVIAENFEPSPSERGILFEELRKWTRDVIRRFTGKVADARKAMRSGSSRIRWSDRPEVDFEQNLLHYDKNNFQNGVKTGSLRLVQYGLMRFIINRVRSGQSCEVDLMLPSNILWRIDALQSSKILPLSNQETEDLKFAYAYLLYMHHMVQLGSIESGQTVFEVDAADMKDMKKMFVDLEKIIGKLSGE